MRATYLLYELAWAAPVIVIQWLVAGSELWRRRRAISLAVAAATLYLAACDGFALGHGIWRVDSRRVLGLSLGPLPLEEALFYLVTNVMAAQGFVMLTGYLREKRSARKR